MPCVLGDIHPAYRLGHVRPGQQLALDRGPVPLQVLLELGHTDAIDTGRALVAQHPLIRRHQIAALHHGFHQAAVPHLLRFRPQMARQFGLDTHDGTDRILSRLLRVRPATGAGLCLHRLHRDTTAYSRSLTFGPSVRGGTYYGLG